MQPTRDVFKYQLVEGWGYGPAGWELGKVGDVAVDEIDRVYVANWEPRPAVVIFDSAGRALASWDGGGVFGTPHGISVRGEQVYVTSADKHAVFVFATDGTLLQTLGTLGEEGSPGQPFNMPTRTLAARWGDLYVADGYGQARVHCFSPEGKLRFSWGQLGRGPGQFNCPHALAIDRDNRLLVVDRHNHRVQVFDKQGNYLTQWGGLVEPLDICIDRQDVVYVSEIEKRVSMFSLDGEPLGTSSCEGIHGIAVDARGALYGAAGPRMQKLERV